MFAAVIEGLEKVRLVIDVDTEVVVTNVPVTRVTVLDVEVGVRLKHD
jgi:hypothetical protein